ncbi:oxidoreductase [Halococcus sp. IIIV-5B]|uniref:oxidoreductase n=1 Tax=Halococcus sp. IIIV-5B TaxID=2321230 RepID=UPI000E7393F3|nr:oxidoreductase [Halococcus sp. IIIV-5B]RJT07106.1 SDR family NAD(P)-dependent oxidoreductase [Halococcus sp. IIIV-5B]
MSEKYGYNGSTDGVPSASTHIGTVIVTGANSGLGFEVTRALAEQGAHIVMACRSIERGEEAKQKIESEFLGASLTVHELDLADLDSVAAFAEWFKSTHDGLNVLCNNAGVMAIPRQETADGFEYQFGVNYLGHFALTAHLLPIMQQTTGESRVVMQSSVGHRNGEIDFDDLQGEESYSAWDAYGQSKLANLLFAYELDRRLHVAKASVKSLGCHPGASTTNLVHYSAEQGGFRLDLRLMSLMNAILAQSAERGAEPMVYAATDPGIEGGEYVGPDGLMNMRGDPMLQPSSERSYNEELARRLWDVSEDLTGVSFELPGPN